jgi:hypothetical protein
VQLYEEAMRDAALANATAPQATTGTRPLKVQVQKALRSKHSENRITTA